MMKSFIKNPIHVLSFSLFFEIQFYLLPFLLLFYYQNGLTKSDFFLFQSIFFFVSVLLEIPTGYIADLISRKWIIIFAYLFHCLRLFLFLSFSGYYIVLAGEICYAICRSLLSGSVDSYIYDYLTQTHSKKMLSKYGRIASYMAFGSAWSCLTSAFLYQNYGIVGLLITEFITASIGVLLVCFLPNISDYQKRKISIKEVICSFKFICKQTFLLYLILFAGLCLACTSLFHTSFQPILSAAALPPIFFSLIYFFNHLTRGIFSHFSKEIFSFFNFKKLFLLVSILITFSFAGLCIASSIHVTWFVLLILIIACISIAFHLSVQNYAVAELHAVASSTTRATCSSVMNMILKCMSGFFLFAFRNTSDKIGSQLSYIIFGTFFLICLIWLYHQIMRQNKASEA